MKIGVLSDLSGIYESAAGNGSVEESQQFYLADSGLPFQAVIGAIFAVRIRPFRHGIIGEIQRIRARWH